MRIRFSLLPSLLVSLVVCSQAVQAADARDLLNGANEAARKLNYSGTYVYHHGQHTEVLRVSHRVDAQGERQKVEVLDGPRREFLRINNEVYCHLTDGKTVRVNKNAIQRFFPAVLPDNTLQLIRYYKPRLGGKEKVAGRDCQVVILEPRDNFRFTQILWLDQQTQLPLKTKTVDNNGSPVSMFVFSEIQIGRQPDKDVFEVRTAGKHIQSAELFSRSASDENWVITPPPGYATILETVRPLQGRKYPVMHRMYSDGISSLSVFIEPIAESGAHLEGLSIESPINVYSRQVAGHKVTAMGEVPAAALLKTANSVQKK